MVDSDHVIGYAYAMYQAECFEVNSEDRMLYRMQPTFLLTIVYITTIITILYRMSATKTSAGTSQSETHRLLSRQPPMVR